MNRTKKLLSLMLVLTMTLSLVVPAFAYGEDTSETIAAGIEDRLEQEAITDTNEVAEDVQEAADTAAEDVEATEPEMSVLEQLVEEMAELPAAAEQAVADAAQAATDTAVAAGAVADAYSDGVQAVEDRDQEALDAQKEKATEKVAEAETAKNDAVQIYNEAKAAVDAAQQAFDDAKAEENLETLQAELDAAQQALADAVAERAKAEAQYDYARIYEAVSAMLATTKDGFSGVNESDAVMKILNEMIGADGKLRDEEGNLIISYNPQKDLLWKAGSDVYHEREGADEAYAETVKDLKLMDMVLAAIAEGNNRVDLEADVNPKLEAALRAKMENKFGTGFMANLATSVAMNQFGFQHEKFLDLTTEDQDTVLLMLHALYNAGTDPDGRTEIMFNQGISNQTVINLVESITSKSGSPIAGKDILSVYVKITDDVVEKQADAAAAKEAVDKAMTDYDEAQCAVEAAQERLDKLKADAATRGSVKRAEADLLAAQEAMERAEAQKDAAVAAYDAAYDDYVATIALNIKPLEIPDEDEDDTNDNDNGNPVINDNDDDRDSDDDTVDTVDITDPATPLTSGPVTRAQFLDYLWRYMTRPEFETVCTFVDVKSDHEYFLALSWAEDTEVAKAFEDGTFKPDELVTVKAVREFLTNFAKAFDLDVTVVAKLTTLTGEDDAPVLNCDQVLAEFFKLAMLEKAAA